MTSPGNYITRRAHGTTSFEVYGCNMESDKGWYYSSALGGLNPDPATIATATVCLGTAGDTTPPDMSATALFTAPS